MPIPMIFSWWYFFILQGIILLTFKLNKNAGDDQAKFLLFPSRLHFLIFNTCILTACYIYNTERQLFCIPVLWAGTLIILSCLSFLSFPYLNYKHFLKVVLPVFLGMALFICIYVLLFARFEYIILVAFSLPLIIILHGIIKFIKKRYQSDLFNAFYFYPCLIIAPFFLLYQILNLKKTLNSIQKKIFWLTPVAILLTLTLTTLRIKTIVSEIRNYNVEEQMVSNLIANPVDYYLTELVLGAHWKYHTELCLYDGKRPPFHDPVLVAANKILNPFSQFDQGIHYQDAKILHKKTFPENPTTFDCVCAKNEHLFDFH